MVYFIGIFGLYLSLFIFTISKYKYRSIGYLFILYFALISVFRGNVGTDTAVYEYLFTQIYIDDLANIFEPGFSLTALISVAIAGSPEWGVRLISALYFILVAFYYRKANKDEVFLLLAFYGPAFFYAYSMNGIRIGLASIILLIGLQILLRADRIKSFLLMLASFFFHYTILFALFFVSLNLLKNLQWWKILIISIIGFIFLIFIQDTLFNKIDLYTDSERPDDLSGLSTVIIIFILIIGVFLSSLNVNSRINIILITISSTIILYFDNLLGYAGLRFLNIIAFALPVTILMSHHYEEKRMNIKLKFFIFIAGLLSALALYRSWTIDYGIGPSPFLPYEFY